MLKELDDKIQKQDNLNRIFYEDETDTDYYHRYEISRDIDTPAGVNILPIASIQFQKGPRNIEGATPGVLEGDLLEVVRHRLSNFQKGKLATRENEIALRHIEEALLWINKRKEDRKYRGVLGTNNK